MAKASKVKKKAPVKPKKVAVKLAKKVAPKMAKKAVKKIVAKPKKKKVSVQAKGYSTVTAYLIMSQNAAAAINFYKKVFAAKEIKRMEHPAGKIMHCELKMGDAKIMLADECPEMHARGPKAFGGSPVGMYIYIKDVDAVVKNAVKNGAKLISAVQDMFYGDRSGTIEDPYGHTWTIATHIEDVTPAKMKKRAAELFHKKA